MTGKFLVILLAVIAIVAGVTMYYLQVYAYYEEIPPEIAEVQLVSLETGVPEPIGFENFKGIDSDSSPVRYRACFDPVEDVGTLSQTYRIADGAEPLVAPGWFDCFDAVAIGAALEQGEAVAFMGVENVRYGIDRIVAVMPDGRAVSWQQINACGEMVFDGNAAPEGCPEPPERLR